MQIQTVDQDKRGKIILVSFVVTFLAFFLKISQQSESISMFQVYLNAGIVAVVGYIGLVWALKFQVTLRSLVYVISQSAIIIFVLTLFLEMFVFRRVGRVYEALILFIVSLLMFFATYASLLMSNIFNVAQFKEIPLVMVGKTTSLILTILSLFFATYVVLESLFNPYVTIILLSVMYFALILTHIRHLGIPRNIIWKRLILIYALLLLSISLQIVVGGNSMLAATVPAVVGYSMISIITVENITKWQKFEFIFMTIIVFIINFFLG